MGIAKSIEKDHHEKNDSQNTSHPVFTAYQSHTIKRVCSYNHRLPDRLHSHRRALELSPNA
jgi:hypothetical protein